MLVRRSNRQTEALLVGLDEELKWFEQSAGKNGKSMLLIVGKLRDERFGADFAKRKNDLMTEAWRPEFFRRSGKR